MIEIRETFELPKEIRNKYIRKLLDNHVLIGNQDLKLTLDKFFLKAFNSMEEVGFAELIKQTAYNDEFLAITIRLGGCLTIFGIKRDKMFHSLNIIASFMDFPQCRSQDCNKILEWIDNCFPFNEVNKFDEGKVQLQKSLNILDV